MRLGPLIGSLVAHAALLAAVAPRMRGGVIAKAPQSQGTPSEELFEVEVIRTSDISDPSVRTDISDPNIRPDTADVREPASRVRLAAGDVRASATTGHAPDETGHAPDTTGHAPDTTGHAPDTTGHAPDTTGHSPERPGSPYMHMRGPELHLSDAEADGILDHPLGPPPQVPRSGRLENAPGGAAVIPDAVTVVSVERDGTAHFHDKPDIDIHFHLPTLPPITERELRNMKEELGKSLRDWYADPEKIARGGHATDLPEHLKAEPGQCDTWGNKMCEPEPMPPPQTIASGKFDLTSYLMRKLGVGDPFASRKRALLDATLAERADRGGRFRGEQLERSAELVRRNLETLWTATTDPAARREALFEMWDECAEGEGPLGEAGQRARAEIIGWIGAHLPRGSAGAYSDDELAALTRRQTSKQAFAPYAPPEPEPRAFDAQPAVVESGDVGSAGSAR